MEMKNKVCFLLYIKNCRELWGSYYLVKSLSESKILVTKGSLWLKYIKRADFDVYGLDTYCQTVLLSPDQGKELTDRIRIEGKDR